MNGFNHTLDTEEERISEVEYRLGEKVIRKEA